MQLVDIATLGTAYNIIDNDGKLVKVIKLINQEDILAAALGPYNEHSYDSMQDYIDGSLERLCGFPKDPAVIFWHTTTEEEFELLDLIDGCVANGYEYIILEMVEQEA